MNTTKVLVGVVAALSALAVTYAIAACNSEGTVLEGDEHMSRRISNEKWNAPCVDESTLIATTTGSPNNFKCWNKHHRMHVQVTTTSSHEEIGALVFCECERETDAR